SAISDAVAKAGYHLGEEAVIALDPAASEFYENGTYILEGEPSNQRKSSAQMVEFWKDWAKRYPIISIEDGLSEFDWAGWKKLTVELGDRVQLVGDDLFVTNVDILRKGITEKVANSILIKVNQIGTLSETVETVLA